MSQLCACCLLPSTPQPLHSSDTELLSPPGLCPFHSTFPDHSPLCPQALQGQHTFSASRHLCLVVTSLGTSWLLLHPGSWSWASICEQSSKFSPLTSRYLQAGFGHGPGHERHEQQHLWSTCYVPGTTLTLY